MTLTEKRFFEWHEDEVSVTLRERGGSYGGSETLVVTSATTPSEPCARETTKESEINMCTRESW